MKQSNGNNEVGFCLYCKNAIYEGEAYVVRNNAYYHPDCYVLIESDTYGISAEDYDETENE
jgi:hypothetical protein